MTIISAFEQLFSFMREQFKRSAVYKPSYYLTTVRIPVTAGGRVSNIILRNPLAYDLNVLGLQIPLVYLSGVAPAGNYTREFSFNFQIEGSQEWFFSDYVDNIKFFPVLSHVIPYMFVRPFVLKSNQAIIINLIDENLVENYNAQFCFICTKEGVV